MDKDNAITNKNLDLSSISKRTGKLVTALYLVTNCIDDREAIKGRLRTLGVDLVSQVSFAEKSSSFDRGISLAEAALVLSEIRVLLSIGGSVSLISEMNASILLNAAENLQNIFEKDGATSFGLPSIDRASGTFMITEEMLGDTNYPELAVQKQTPNLFEKMGTSKSNKTHEQKVFPKGQKDSLKKEATSSKTSRRDEIMSVIQQKREVSVKDVCNVISDCSEKTIQRELLNLVSQGFLKKSGEKRWSRYSLA